MLNELAEGLARNVDTGIQRVASALPAPRPCGENMDAAIAQRLCPPGGPGGDSRHAAVGVAQDEPHTGVRHQRGESQLEPAVRQRHGEEQVRPAELSLLAHIEKRDLRSIGQPRLQGCRIDKCRHRFSR